MFPFTVCAFGFTSAIPVCMLKMAPLNLLESIKKLRGRIHYLIKILFEHEGLTKCIDGTEVDRQKSVHVFTKNAFKAMKYNIKCIVSNYNKPNRETLCESKDVLGTGLGTEGDEIALLSISRWWLAG